MVGDLILHHLQSQLMRLADEILQILHGSEARLDGVEVDRVITVIGVVIRKRVVIDRGHPDAGHAEILEVPEMVADAAEIAAMECPRGIAVHGTPGAGQRRLHRDIGEIT